MDIKLLRTLELSPTKIFFHQNLFGRCSTNSGSLRPTTCRTSSSRFSASATPTTASFATGLEPLIAALRASGPSLSTIPHGLTMA